MIELGYTYKDKITKFEGICVGTVQYLTGCNQALLQPKCDKNGDFKASSWFDEQRLELVKKSVRIVLDNGKNPGFDIPAPKR